MVLCVQWFKYITKVCGVHCSCSITALARSNYDFPKDPSLLCFEIIRCSSFSSCVQFFCLGLTQESVSSLRLNPRENDRNESGRERQGKSTNHSLSSRTICRSPFLFVEPYFQPPGMISAMFAGVMCSPFMRLAPLTCPRDRGYPVALRSFPI